MTKKQEPPDITMLDEENCCDCDKEVPLSERGWGIFSCFRDNDDLGSVDEVTKPLYYIVEEVSSQQMRDFAERTKRLEGSMEGCRFLSVAQPWSLSIFRHKITDPFRRRSRRRHDSETASITRVESVIAVKDPDRCKNGRSTMFRRSNRRPRIVSMKPLKRSWKALSKKLKSLQFLNPLPFSFPKAKASNEYKGFVATESFDTSVGPIEDGSPVILGVSFPHPVFAETVDGKSNGWIPPSRKVWSIDEVKAQDDITLPPTRAVVDTVPADSWGSCGSFPTDECDDSLAERLENGIECNSYFDDTPFDEVDAGEECILESIAGPCSLIEISASHNSGYFFQNDDTDDDDESFAWIHRSDSVKTSEFPPEGLCQMLNASSLFSDNGYKRMARHVSSKL